MQDPRAIMDMVQKGEGGNKLLMHITVIDELRQLAGSATLSTSQITLLPVTLAFMNEFVTTIGQNWENRTALIQATYVDLASTVKNGIPISPSAFSGLATIHANLLTDYPGVAYCPEGTTPIWLRKSFGA